MKSQTLIPVTAPIDEPFEPPLKKFWWLKRLSLLGVLIVLTVFAVRAWMVHSENNRLQAEVARWVKAGLPIKPADFETPDVPDDQNAAVAINLAAAAVFKKKEWYDEQEKFGLVPLDANARQIADDTLAANAEALHAIRQARKLTRWKWQPFQARRFTNTPTDLHQPNWSGHRVLIEVLRLSAIRSIDRKDEIAFLDAVSDMQFISHVLAKESSVLSDLISASLDAMATQAAMPCFQEMDFSGPDNLTKRKLAVAIIREWADESDRGSNVKLCLARQARDALKNLTGPAPVTKFFVKDSGWVELKTNVLDHAIYWYFLPQRLRVAADELVRYRTDIELRNYAKWSTTGLHAAIESRSQETGLKLIDSAMAQVIQTSFDNSNYFRSRFRVMQSVRFAAISLACRLYSIDHHGKDPNALTDLVPSYLTSVPVDPFTPGEGPIHYVAGTSGLGPYLYGLSDLGIDFIASGSFKPTVADHMEWRSPCFVAFLRPQLATPATLPTTLPASTKPVNQ